MPAGEIVTVDGEQMRCYTLEEGKQIAHLVVDYEDLFAAAGRWDSERLAFESKIGGLELQLEAQAGLAELYQENSVWWQDMFEASQEELQKKSKYDRWKWVPWVLPAIVGLAWGITASVN